MFFDFAIFANVTCAYQYQSSRSSGVFDAADGLSNDDFENPIKPHSMLQVNEVVGGILSGLEMLDLMRMETVGGCENE